MAELHDIVEIVETWRVKRTQYTQFTAKDMRTFVEVMNYHTRQLISTLGITDPEFYSGLFELANHAQTLATKKARVIADGIDRTNV